MKDYWNTIVLLTLCLCFVMWLASHLYLKFVSQIRPIPEPDEQEENWFFIANPAEAARKIQAGADLCWRQARNGDNGERLCQAYQQAAGQIEAAVSLIKKASV
jgi:hypothetical protein